MTPKTRRELPPNLDDGFDQPTAVDAVLLAFPTANEKLLPAWDSIPEDFQRGHTPWNRFVSQWFFRGWPVEHVIYTRPDVAGEMAFRHLSVLLRSWDLEHEHKEAAVAWLMSRWFLDLKLSTDGSRK